MRGNAAIWRFAQQPTKDNNIAIRAFYEQALEIDPNDAEALVGVAGTYGNEYGFWANPEAELTITKKYSVQSIDPSPSIAITRKQPIW